MEGTLIFKGYNWNKLSSQNVDIILFSMFSSVHNQPSHICFLLDKDVSYELIRDKFEILAKTHFVQRCPIVEDGRELDAVPSFVIPVSTSYVVPHINFRGKNSFLS